MNTLPKQPLSLSAAVASVVLVLPAAGASAAELRLKVQIPQLDVAEYHRPYVAAWIEGADRKVAANLAIWYQLKRGNEQGANAEGGTKWLPDLRQWWRRTGRDLKMPADGITSATRAPGEHELGFKSGETPLGELPPGQYTLMVEAAREEGGRELLKIPFEWPGTAAVALSAQGERELGVLNLSIQP